MKTSVTGEAANIRPTTRRLTVFGLFIVGVMAYVDRTIISILQVPIKSDLDLTDAQLGALTGIAFAIIYTSMAIPIARLADRSSRKWVILGGLFLWSATTLLSGFATGFVALVVLRMGVGLGESGCVPASHSLIADLYPPERRVRAVSLWGLNLPVGMLVGLSATGFLASHLGWRASFWVIGGCGLVIVPVLGGMLKEPKRGTFDPAHASELASEKLIQNLVLLWRIKTFRFLVLGGAMHALVQYSLLFWTAPFYARVHHLTLAEIGWDLAILNGVGGGAGIWLGGWFANRLGFRDVRWQLRVPAIASLAMIPVAALQFLVASPALSLGTGLFASALVVFYYAPIVATPMAVVPARIRALASAVIMASFNLAGLGLGPFLSGLISDFLIVNYHMIDDSLRYTIVVMLLPSLLAFWLFWKGSSHLPAEHLDARHRADVHPDRERSSVSPAPLVMAPDRQ